jgi:hypothetical protein
MDEKKNKIFEELNNIRPGLVTRDSEILKSYSSDYSFVRPRMPNYVTFPKKCTEIQEIVEVANRSRVPLIPRSSRVSFHGEGIPTQGGIILDLKGMNQILEIDERNRKAMIEPGVTYGQLQSSLEKYSLMALNPLLPHTGKSVLSSHLERDPMLIPKFEYGDPILAMEVVLPTGDILRTGSAAAPGSPHDTLVNLVGPHGPGLDFVKFFQAAQGTLGIVTWMTIKVEYLPKVQRLFFIPFNSVEKVIDPTYKIQRLMLGNECFILNNIYLASILAGEREDEVERLKKDLPPWIIFLCVTGGYRRAEEKIEYEEEILEAIGSKFSLEIFTEIPGAPGKGKVFEKVLRKPWPENIPYWKLRPNSGSQTTSFHTTLERIPEFHSSISNKFGRLGEEMGCYMQPIERARVCYCEYGLSYDPLDSEERENVRQFHNDLNVFLCEKGAFFTRPYGIQSEIIYSRNAQYSMVLKELKGIFDPNNIMNPRKLCF